MNFSDEQLKVINTEKKNILVSAAAGSGKTAVLVERIIRKITDITNPVDIDSILVMTFTNAAAAEMRERIEKAVNAKLESELVASENKGLIAHLKRQAGLVRKAYISTIDSFCKEVIKNNFSQIGLDPAFRIAEEAELTLLKSDVMASLMEDAYESASEEFLDFIENFSVKKSDNDIEKAVKALYEYSQSKPEPKKWLQSCSDNYSFENAEELFDSDLVKDYLDGIYDQIDSMVKETMVDITTSEGPGGPYKYIEALQSDVDAFNQLLTIKDYDFLLRAIDNLEFAKFGRITAKDEDIDEALKEYVKGNRDRRKTKIKSLFNKTLAKTKQDVFEDICHSKDVVKALANLAIGFLDRYDEAKRELQILDFSDLEHLALRILYDDRMENPSDVAVAYQNKFNEIMVDEYQDSNDVQEWLIQAISRENNVFTVGDVKQSIYKFRLAKPELFLEKQNTYLLNENLTNDNNIKDQSLQAREYHNCEDEKMLINNSVRIDLHNNYRSSNAVLDAANFVFEKIMHKSVGKVEYDRDARLNHGRITDDCLNSEAEMMLIEPMDGVDDKEIEALAVCQKIEELMNNYTVPDKDTGEERKLRYSDITILLRTRAGWEDIFSKVLANYDIPNHSENDTGYFNSYEIRNIIDYLRLLNNPLNDEVLASVFLGPFGGFTDRELSEIRIFSKEGCFYQSVEAYLTQENQEIIEDVRENEAADEEYNSDALLQRKKVYIKLCDFYDTLDNFRKIAPFTPVHELIEKIITKFNYDLLLKSMENGQKRYMNLTALLVRAKDFEKTSFKGLFDFIRYIEKLRSFDIDYGELDTIGENDDCVRIMSIHKSKGLEFPVTFICGCAKQYNEMDVNAPIVMDDEQGIGINYIDAKNRTKATTIIKEAIRFKQRKDIYGEELRVLYVAMTRAREKTIVTGVVTDEELDSYMNRESSDVLSMSEILNCNSYLKLLLSACINDKNAPFGITRLKSEEILNKIEEDSVSKEAESVSINIDSFNENDDVNKNSDNDKNEKNNVINNKYSSVTDDELSKEDLVYINQLKSNLQYKYPYKVEQDVPMKLSVSAIKHMSMEEKAADDRFDSIPKLDSKDEAKVPYFISGAKRQELIGALRGTAYHRFFELLAFKMSYVNHNKTDNSESYVNHDKIDNSESYVNQSDNADIQNYVNNNALDLSTWLDTQKQEFVKKNLITQDEVDCIKNADITKFMSTKLYERMSVANEANMLFKEQPFTYLVKASEVEKVYPNDEDIIVQGIIDAFFYEGDDIVIMDYKTDRVKSGKELVDRYEKQLELYAQALEQITGKKVKECIIYSVALGESIRL